MISALLGANVFEGFFQAVAWFLAQLYALTGSYGGAIILLTIVVMIVTAPLTLKSTRSMLQMQRHQPELKKLQAKYKDDREKLNTELMAFYKENGINPLSGCVPVLMQAPIFLVLYRVLHGITTRATLSGGGIGRVAGGIVSGEEFRPWKLHDQVFEPQHLDTGTEMYRALHNSTKMSFLGVDLSLSPLDAVRIGWVTAIPFLVLMVAMLISQIIQNRQIQGRSQGAQNPQQQMIMKVLPFMLPVFSFQFAAGLGLYYFVQGLCRIGLQGYITHKVYKPHNEELAKKPVDVTSTEKAGKAASTKGDKATIPAGAKGTGKKSGTNGSSSPRSAKSQAVQKKKSGAAPTQVGRRSGDPRAGSEKRRG